MAAPSGVTAIWGYVIVTVDNSSLGVVGNTPSTMAGTVETIGLNVTKCVVGDVIVFKFDNKTSNVFSLGGDETWAVISQDDVLLTYVAV